jgi:hypothetical protein
MRSPIAWYKTLPPALGAALRMARANPEFPNGFRITINEGAAGRFRVHPNDNDPTFADVPLVAVVIAGPTEA